MANYCFEDHIHRNWPPLQEIKDTEGELQRLHFKFFEDLSAIQWVELFHLKEQISVCGAPGVPKVLFNQVTYRWPMLIFLRFFQAPNNNVIRIAIDMIWKLTGWMLTRAGQKRDSIKSIFTWHRPYFVWMNIFLFLLIIAWYGDLVRLHSIHNQMNDLLSL